MDVLAFGTYDVHAHPRVQVLIDGLIEHGLTVTEINEPLGIGTEARVAMLMQPWRAARLLPIVARRWLALYRAVRATRTDPDVVLVGYLAHFDVHLARHQFPHSTLVLDHLISAADTASDRGASGMAKTQLLTRLDSAATGAADIIVVDTDEHRDALPPGVRERAVTVPVGADEAWFRVRRQRPDPSAPLSIVFFGMFTPLQGTPVIADALAELHHWGIPFRATMVGHGQELGPCRQRLGGGEQVTWRPWVDPAELPQLVAEHDVCLGIFGTSSKARRVVPTKVYQGAAAGCAIVTSDTEPQRRAMGQAARYVPPGDARVLAYALRVLAEDPEELTRLKAGAAQTARRSFAASVVVGPLVDRFGGATIGRER